MTDQPVAPCKLPCDVAILFRDAETAGGLVDRLQDAADLRANGFSIRLGKLGERVVALAIAGNSTSLIAMTDAVVHAHRPQLVVFGTLAIGLADGLQVNTVLLASALVAEAGEQLELPPWTESPQQRGLLWATNQLAPPPANSLAAIPPDLYAAAQWCRDRELAVEIAAVVTRHAGDQAPADVRQVLNQPSLAGQIGALLGAAWRRPSSVPDLWRQKETILIARERLGDAIETMVAPTT